AFVNNFTGVNDTLRTLWRSNGTHAGTYPVKDIFPDGYAYVYDITVYNGALYFGADDGINGRELWKSDGTKQGTQLLKDIWPGTSGSGPENFKVYQGLLYFFARNDISEGDDLWVTDGTTSGTHKVANTMG